LIEQGTEALDEQTEEVACSCYPMAGKAEIIPLAQSVLHTVTLKHQPNNQLEIYVNVISTQLKNLFFLLKNFNPMHFTGFWVKSGFLKKAQLDRYCPHQVNIQKFANS